MRDESQNRKMTHAGFIDLSSITRRPYPNLEIATEIQRIFRAQGVEGLQIHQGTVSERPFLELSTNSEASVFRALEAAADALLHVRSQFPGAVDSFEMYLLTSSRDRAGQFLITEEAATALAENLVDTSVFFVRQVQF